VDASEWWVPAGDPGEARIAGRADYVCGVADGAVVLGAVDPPDPLEPEPEPPMFGQSPFIPPVCPGWVEGAVVPPFVSGVVVVLGAGDAEGSGLAAETTATAPPTRSMADSAAVRTMRLTPGPVVDSTARSVPA
jgi:hypothetical protein